MINLCSTVTKGRPKKHPLRNKRFGDIIETVEKVVKTQNNVKDKFEKEETKFTKQKLPARTEVKQEQQNQTQSQHHCSADDQQPPQLKA